MEVKETMNDLTDSWWYKDNQPVHFIEGMVGPLQLEGDKWHGPFETRGHAIADMTRRELHEETAALDERDELEALRQRVIQLEVAIAEALASLSNLTHANAQYNPSALEAYSVLSKALNAPERQS